MSEISKAYEPQSVEDKWYQFWLDQKCFVADVQSKKPAYSIVIPPPNITGVLHMGHVLNNTIQDILARKARMDGKEVLWLPGTDHASIATHMVLERKLKKEEGITRYDLGREKFIGRAWEWREKHGGIIISQLKKLGCSCDWSRLRFTMDDDYNRCVARVFVELYKKGLIYRGKRMVNWCPATQTALSDEEVIMKEQKGALYYFKVEIAEQPGTFLTIATTRPETIPGDTAVAVNPKDPRYAHLIGKHVIRPLPAELPREQKLIPIIGDEHVDFEFGTGVLKVTPAHDKADFEIGQRHRLAQIDIMHPNGHMNELAGKDLNGLDRFKARKVAMEKLAELGALEKEEPYTNNVGFSERADVPIEPRLSEQWFLKYPSVEKARNCVRQENEPDVLVERNVAIVHAAGRELAAATIHELRRAALNYARSKGFLGKAFLNEDSGISLRVRRQSLSHAFSNRGEANIKAVSVLPGLIRTAIWISSEKHQGASPRFKRVHRFAAAMSLDGELHRVMIVAKELADGTVLYDHKVKKITPGGKSLVAHLPKETLGIQPAPGAVVRLSELLTDVNAGKMRFHPQRWAKVYDHWMEGIKDWCISRQLWWGHRIPVWQASPRCAHTERDRAKELLKQALKEHPDLVKVEWEAGKRNDETFRKYGMPGRMVTIEACISPELDLLIKDLEALGFTQDPDVLDTWFSSWLWPFATMGWPEQTATLKKFYPTNDLVTGPDIIFFWVARMIMAGYEFMGDPKFGLPDAMPFRNVYFTGIIRDKQGRKMSKSLGNSPDPLDLIGKYGADALRFGTMRSAPLGQDILFDEQNVELGRNFCNKLWNACRFRQMVGSAGGSPANEGGLPEQFKIQGEIDPKLLTPDDKWILLKLDAAIREMNIAFAEYKFSDATATLYRFFWSEYCDWYVEASKAALSGGSRGNEAQTEKAGTDQSLLTSAATESRKANTLAVIDFVLSHTLRLFHPFLPFITEELWHGMGYADDMPENQGGRTIMFAPWPKPLDDDFKEHYGLTDTSEKLADAKYELVSLGRNLRREFNIQANKKIKFVFKPAGQLSALDAEILKFLLNADSVEIKTTLPPPKGTPMVANALGELFLPLEGLVDAEAEKNRLKKEQEKFTAEIAKVEQKLANPNFAQKVPENVLEEHKQRLANWQVKLAQVKSALAALES